MSDPHLLPRRGPPRELLAQRQEHLRLMIDSHLRWMQQTNDETVKSMHRALVESLDMVLEQYQILLDQMNKAGGTR